MGITDLTLTISERLPVFPGSPGPRFIPWNGLVPDGYNLEMLFLSSHTGTHMDAPRHFIDGAAGIDQIPVGRLVTDALLIKTGPSKSITKKDILRFEAKNGIPGGSTVVFFTGWSDRPSRKNYFGANPGLCADAAEYLASKKVNMVGIDSPSIDLGTDPKFPAHRILSKNNILIIENLANLKGIKSRRFRMAVLPLKLRNATGSPVRAIAL